ncbi:MAG TPA: hypothetical protein VEC93_03540, partial [Anaerolineae bacterium]|nr:hypothetical protein [Anaerolineae bacterium]
KMGLEFHSRFVACPLKPFDEQETRYVVQTLLRGTNIEFAEQEFNYIWQLSQSLAGGAHPIFVQMAGSLIFAYKRNNQNLIDYFPLEAEFKKQTEKYRAELPEPPPPAIIDYELALNTLEQSLPIDNSDLTLEFYKWAKLFRRIHEAEPSQDPSPPSPNDREVIVNELTRLALKITGLSLEQLASGQKP